jgi:hypothetical protein
MFDQPRTILASTFSPSMLPPDGDALDLRFERLPLIQLLQDLENTEWESAIRYLGLAETLTDLLGMEVSIGRRSIQLLPGIRLLVVKPAMKIDWQRATREERDAIKFQCFEVRNWTDTHQRMAA